MLSIPKDVKEYFSPKLRQNQLKTLNKNTIQLHFRHILNLFQTVFTWYQVSTDHFLMNDFLTSREEDFPSEAENIVSATA